MSNIGKFDIKHPLNSLSENFNNIVSYSGIAAKKYILDPLGKNVTTYGEYKNMTNE